MNIDVNNISFYYGSNKAIENISLQIGAGSKVALIGANGSGKSTLLKCLCGVLKPDSGIISVDGIRLDKVHHPWQAQKIAYVPQDDFEPSFMSVFDYLMLGRRPYIRWHENDSDIDKVIKIIERLGLQDVCMRNLDSLSGGQRQLIRIARALCQSPEVILLDEPTSNLDLNHRKMIMHILQSLADENISVIMAMHDINLAFDYFNDIIMLKNGTMFCHGGHELANNIILNNLFDTDLNVINVDGRVVVIQTK